MKAIYRLIFNRKNKKLLPDEKALIQIEIYLTDARPSRRKYISTGIYLRQDQWKKDRIVKHPNQVDLNLYIKNQIQKIENYELSLINSGKKFTFELLDRFLIGGEIDISFLDFIQNEAEQDTRIREGTRKHHISLIRCLERFGLIKEFSDLTYKNIEKFDNYLHLKNYKQSTIYGYHKRMKAYIQRAIRKDYFNFQDNPYLRFKVKRGESEERRFLTPDELKRLELKKLPIERLDQVRDYFLFSCYTGLAYQDLESLSEDNFFENEGETWIRVYRTKTNVKSVIPLLPKAKKILEKYNYSLPVITNQKTNAFLKEIAVLCEIKEKLTTHVARHTFATTVTLAQGISLEVVSAMLGHKSIKTTQIYAKMLNTRIREEMKKIRDL